MSRTGDIIHRCFSWFPLYKALVGGYWYYSYVRESTYLPSDFAACGKNVRIGRGTLIQAPDRVRIGDHCFIGSLCAISGLGGLSIGSYCAIAAHVSILTTEHDFRDARSIPWGDVRIAKPVLIDDFAWIGTNASILPGVHIGEGAIVGMGAVVPRDVPARAVVVGNPAKVVRYRDEAEFQRLKSTGALRPPTKRCSQIRIPPDVQEKYAALLQNVVFKNVDAADTFDF